MTLSPSAQARQDYVALCLTSLVVAVASTILLLQANGYVIDFRTLTVTRVGLIVVDPTTPDLSFTLDGADHPTLTSRHELLLPPGQVRLRATRAGATTWVASASIQPGQVSRLSDIRVFPLAVPMETTSATSEDLLRPLVGETFLITQTELYRLTPTPQYITRLSHPIRSCIQLDRGHIAYQIRDELHVMELNGANDIMVYRLDQAQPARLGASQHGDVLRVTQGAVTRLLYLQLFDASPAT